MTRLGYFWKVLETSSVTRFCKFHHLGNILSIFVKGLRVYSVLGKFLNLLWQNCNALGQPFKVVHGLTLKNNIDIWLHWSDKTILTRFRETITLVIIVYLPIYVPSYVLLYSPNVCHVTSCSNK